MTIDANGYFEVDHEMFDANGNFHGKGMPCLRLAADGAPLHLLPQAHGASCVMSAMDVADLWLVGQKSVDGADGFSTAMLPDGCSRGCCVPVAAVSLEAKMVTLGAAVPCPRCLSSTVYGVTQLCST